MVLKYVQNKDVFMRYHKAHLTRRLILDISADSEIEENMVEWLRVSSLTSFFVWLCLLLVVLIPTLELRYPSRLGEFYLKLQATQDILYFRFIAVLCESKAV